MEPRFTPRAKRTRASHTVKSDREITKTLEGNPEAIANCAAYCKAGQACHNSQCRSAHFLQTADERFRAAHTTCEECYEKVEIKQFYADAKGRIPRRTCCGTQLNCPIHDGGKDLCPFRDGCILAHRDKEAAAEQPMLASSASAVANNMSQEITGTNRRNLDKRRTDKAVTEPAPRDKASTLSKLRLVNYSIAGLREHRNGTCSNQKAVLQEDCKQWIFVDGTAPRVLLKGADAKRSKIDTENAKLANYRNEEFSDLRNTVKTKTTIVRRRNGGGIMTHHMEPDFRNT